MKIGFDAKRAFQNNTGLGHYSRTLISSLAEFYPGNRYVLFAPKITNKFPEAAELYSVSPHTFPYTIFRSAWRSFRVAALAAKEGIDLYHGLSQELPYGIQSKAFKSVVTIHDLIFERYPHQYNPIDVRIYRKKFKHACRVADTVIAISEQTKQDLVDYYKVPAEKITVCYQSCNPAYFITVEESEKEKVRKLYSLPNQYFLSVGSIIERKNLLSICSAMLQLKDLPIPLVVIGNGGAYLQKVKTFVREHNLDARVIFLSETETARNEEGFKNSAHFPAIYQMATAFIYPSIYEGFGIPVLEALASRTPVITSNVSCLPEAGGNASMYIAPYDVQDLADKMRNLAGNAALANSMREKGWLHAQQFTTERAAAAVMQVYKNLVE